MKIDQQLKFIVIHKQADSLYSLIADGQYRNTSLGRDKWKELIGSQGSLQYNCNKEGSFVVTFKVLKPELVLLTTTRMSVTRATQGSDLAQGVTLTIPARVVTRLLFQKIMETVTSKPWDTSWYNKYYYCFAKNLISLIVNIQFSLFQAQPLG